MTRYPQSNGHAERNVKIMKDLIVKTNHDIGSKEFLDGIIQIRNSPRADGLSPCQVVFGRSVRTLIPTQNIPVAKPNFAIGEMVFPWRPP